MSISRDEVLRIARLARLDVREEDLDGLVRDLDAILGYAARLEEAEAGERETAPEGTPLRDDIAVPGLPPGRATHGAPAAAEGLFRVPPVIDDP